MFTHSYILYMLLGVFVITHDSHDNNVLCWCILFGVYAGLIDDFMCLLSLFKSMLERSVLLMEDFRSILPSATKCIEVSDWS